MTLLGERDYEVLPLPPEDTRRRLADTWIHSLVETYDHLAFHGLAYFNDPDRPELSIVIRQSTLLTAQRRMLKTPFVEPAQNKEEKPRPGLRMSLEPRSFAVATSDGIDITRWRPDSAHWKLYDGFLLTSGPRDNRLIIDLVPDGQGDVDDPITAQLVLAGTWGSLQFGDEKVVGNLHGHDEFWDGPKLIDCPA